MENENSWNKEVAQAVEGETIESNAEYPTPTIAELEEKVVSGENKQHIRDALRVWSDSLVNISHSQALRDFTDITDSLHTVNPEELKLLVIDCGLDIDKISESIKPYIEVKKRGNNMSADYMIYLDRFNNAFPQNRQLLSFAEGTSEIDSVKDELENIRINEPVLYWQRIASTRDSVVSSVEKFGLNDTELLEEGKKFLSELEEKEDAKSLLSVANSLHRLFPEEEIVLPESVSKYVTEEVNSKLNNEYFLLESLRLLADLKAVSQPIVRNKLSDVGVSYSKTN